MKKRFSTLTIIIACIVTSFITIVASSSVFINKYGGQEVFPYVTKFSAIYKIINEQFIGDADVDKVADLAYRYMVAGIGDKWSYYMNAEEYAEYQQYQKNSYSGIGITIERDTESDLYCVKTLEKDLPAFKAGVKLGDLLCAIDSERLEGLGSDEVKRMIALKAGEEFELTLKDESGVERTVTVAAVTIFRDPIKFEMLADDVGYIKIDNFDGESAKGAIAAIDELISAGARGIVFDVRNNPGGFLGELTTLLDYILPEGDIFISKGLDGVENITRSDAKCIDVPMTVLVNENSYSAAEFFVAALSEFDYAKSIGNQTTGKSRSQITLELTDGSAVHISTNSYLTPKRVDLAKQGGLTPDITIEISEEDAAKLASGLLEHSEDQQLSEAISVLKKQIDE